MEKTALDSSLFVSDEIHQKDVVLSDDKQHKLYFREMTALEFRRYVHMEQSSDEAERERAVPWIIAACVVTPAGNEAMTLGQACRLKPEPMGAIFSIIMDMNGVRAGDKPGKA